MNDGNLCADEELRWEINGESVSSGSEVWTELPVLEASTASF
jgi:hypothetical protein